MKRPAYYAPVGSLSGDLIALLHPPYTAWHLSHVAIGAALAPRVDWPVLAATLLAFFFGTGVAAHAIDEKNGRPLHTALSERTLTLLAVGGLLASLVVAAIGAVRLSPWVLAWAGVGVLLAAGYGLEKPAALHTSLGFALAWGGFPVLVGFWAQTQAITDRSRGRGRRRHFDLDGPAHPQHSGPPCPPKYRSGRDDPLAWNERGEMG